VLFVQMQLFFYLIYTQIIIAQMLPTAWLIVLSRNYNVTN